jgi:monofunctional chorismate mutase
MDNLDEIRSRIDGVDAQMTSLFEQRMELVREVVAYKTAHGLAIVDPTREQDVIRRNASRVSDRDIREYYVNFQQEVMRISRDWQRRLSKGLKVAYSGVPGAFGYIAAGRLYPGAERLAFADFEDAYRACERGRPTWPCSRSRTVPPARSRP